MIRTLIVEDSPVAQELLLHILGSDPKIKIVGVASDGARAVEAVEQLKPDVVTMDIHMPGLNGFDTTRRIMEKSPVPIIIVTGDCDYASSDKLFSAMDAGALAIVRKPGGVNHPDYTKDSSTLIATVKSMSEIKVVRRWAKTNGSPTAVIPVFEGKNLESRGIKLVAIGASTGGPPVINEIFAGLPKDLSVPLLVVQHMSAGFMENFVKWLTISSGFPAQIAKHGDVLSPGHAYFAPDGFHMLVGRDKRIILSGDPPENGLRPAVSMLFRSVAQVYGSSALGILLTGMGKDGAEDLKLMLSKGAMTVAQDKDSSVIFGMPGEAIKIGAAEYVLPPEKMARLISGLRCKR